MMDVHILYHKRPRIWTGITTTDDAVSVTVSPSSRSNSTVGRLFERLNIFFYGIIFIIITCCLGIGRFRLQVVYPRMNVRWPVRNSGERIDWHRRNGTVKMIVIFVVVIADCRTTNSVNLKDNHHLLVFCFKLSFRLMMYFVILSPVCHLLCGTRKVHEWQWSLTPSWSSGKTCLVPDNKNEWMCRNRCCLPL